MFTDKEKLVLRRLIHDRMNKVQQNLTYVLNQVHNYSELSASWNLLADERNYWSDENLVCFEILEKIEGIKS